MSRALAQLPAIAAKLASGDLTFAVDTQRQDEVGQIMNSLHGVRERMLTMVSQLGGATEQLSTTAAKMTIISTQTNSSVQQLHSETDQQI